MSEYVNLWSIEVLTHLKKRCSYKKKLHGIPIVFFFRVYVIYFLVKNLFMHFCIFFKFLTPDSCLACRSLCPLFWKLNYILVLIKDSKFWKLELFSLCYLKR